MTEKRKEPRGASFDDPPGRVGKDGQAVVDDQPEKEEKDKKDEQ